VYSEKNFSSGSTLLLQALKEAAAAVLGQ